MRTSLILGGNGFIGSSVAELLHSRGEPVRVFDRPATALPETLKGARGVEFFEGDFLNVADLEEALEGMEDVYHFICSTLPKRSNEDPLHDVETNLMGTLRLLEFFRRRPGMRLLFISSGGTVYGEPKTLPIPESHPTEPLCSYGIGKLTIEKYLGLYHRLHGLNYRVLRVSNAYGERQNPHSAQGAVAVFLDRILKGEEITVWGDGSVVRDYLYVGDVAEALVRVAATESRVRIFNIGSGRGVSLSELIATLAEVSGKQPRIRYEKARAFDVPANTLDISLAAAELNWVPRVPLYDGLRRVCQAFTAGA
jgi:UDP-glucose 4-epimerase